MRNERVFLTFDIGQHAVPNRDSVKAALVHVHAAVIPLRNRANKALPFENGYDFP